MITLPSEISQKVDDYRFTKRFRTETEALVRLIEAGLEAEAANTVDASTANMKAGER